jgi:exopolyphosphatase/guanosine-5'-triphosphate,3'-diphosphate pyrophosphatase
VGLLEANGQPVVFAAADVGSNATKVLVWEIGAGGVPRERFQKRFALRLSDVFRVGRIEPATVGRLVEIFIEIAAICREHGARQVRAVATEAFRSAGNAREVAEAIALETGIDLQVISSRKEAELVAEGVLLDYLAGAGNLAILDIGGGSTQITIAGLGGRRENTGKMPVLPAVSLPLGAVRLREMFMRSDPMVPADFEAMRRHVEQAMVRGTVSLRGQWSPCAIGCGGGVRFLHTMCGIHGGVAGQDQPVRMDQIEHLCDAIWHMPIEALVRHYGIDRERAEIIVPGGVVLLALMKQLKLNEMRPSGRGVRDGLLAEFLKG